MISPDYCQTMARYNAWQNKGMMEGMSAITPADLAMDRQAFFGSIFATANHLLWGDRLWMSRFDGGPAPEVEGADSVRLHAQLQGFLEDRQSTDARINRWAQGLSEAQLSGPLTWYSGLSKRELSKPKAMCVTHFFNHQTHHRGQIHAMLTAAGYKPDDTDLVLMPEAG